MLRLLSGCATHTYTRVVKYNMLLRISRQDDGDGKENCLAESDKDTIKANIVPLMCRAPPEVQRQVHTIHT